MTFFQFGTSVNELVRQDAPSSRGPTPRWQRKALERRGSYCRSPCPSPMGVQSYAKTPRCKSLSEALFRTPCKTPLKTPLKTPAAKQLATKTPGKGVAAQPASNPGDRFIPNRALMDLDYSNFMITNQDPADEGDNSIKDGGYNSAMSEMLNNRPTENANILTLKQKPPRAREGSCSNLKVLYSSLKSSGKFRIKAKPSRHIPRRAHRVLDAPELRDDFYLNLMDWGAKNLVAVALHNEVYLWNATNGTINTLMKVEGADDYICSVSWIKEGNVLAVGNTHGEIQLWDVERSKCLRSMDSHSARVGSLAWNSFILTSGSRSGKIHHHDVRDANHHIATLTGHRKEVCGLKWNPNGTYLASGGDDNTVNVWDINGSNSLHAFTEHQSAVKALAWCPWQPHVLASGGGTADRHIRFWNCITGTCLNSVDTGSQVSSLLWSAEHKELISGHGFAHSQLTIWKYPLMQRIADLKEHTNRILSTCMSPDQSMVMSAAADETLRLWCCFNNEGAKQKMVTKKAKRTSHALSVGQIR